MKSSPPRRVSRKLAEPVSRSGARLAPASPAADDDASGAGPTPTPASLAADDRFTAGPTPTPASLAADDRSTAGPTPAPTVPHPRRLPAILLSLAVLLAAAGTWCTVETHSAAATGSAANRALTDQPATADVAAAVSLALNQIFSYSYDKTDVTENAAATVLRGRARDSYQKLFAQVRKMAPEQKLILTSRVSATSVQQLSGDRAQLLVFLDQSAARGNSVTPETAAAQLSVTAQRIAGTWFVTDLVPR
ncbi:hypothetical protein [Amycolatopsis benzoatilytica]|uniref:hypothetical protein n=1 Tax=Amycolatopsis benzoatilytica TaxID=346045 RepID=UPI000371F87E|nr:hypothetical protein [Amycolatopsis benzoatilytica]